MTRVRDWGLQERPLNSVHFECPSHTGTLLCGLRGLRAKGLLMDITLVAEGEAFQAHRVVLASCSDYFRAMFTDAMREARQSEVCMNGVPAAGMRLLLDYMYTARLTLNLANVQDVLSAASHVQVVAVVEACSSYLQSQLDLDNCVDVATLSETYSLWQLRRCAYRFMSCHLRELSRRLHLQQLAPSQLEHLLASDYPVDVPEVDVLRIALLWLAWEPSRLPHASRLLRRVRLHEVSRGDWEAVLQQQRRRRRHQLCRHLQALEAGATSASRRTPPVPPPPPLVNSRGMELAVVKVGGFGPAGVTNEVTYRLSSVATWRHLTSIPHVEQCNFGTAVLANQLYVVGGCFNQSLQEHIHPFGFRYSPRHNQWSTMAPMQRERCRFSLNVVRGRLYAVGGTTEEGEEGDDTSPCERYDPATDTWEAVRALPGYRTQHAGAALPRALHDDVDHGGGAGEEGEEDGLLYVCGGLDRDLVLSSMLRYDPHDDTWRPRASLRTPRADHVMVAVRGRLYVCGGWYEDADTGNRVLADAIDVYHVREDTWTEVTRVPTPRYHAGVVGVDATIYFIGGFHSDAMFDRATASIECYDVDTDTWTVGERYPQEVWEHTCVTLYIPRCRDDMEVLATS